jgi:hypothetical protein
MKGARSIILTILLIAASAHATEPLDALKEANPALYKLYNKYPMYHDGLREYANKQGFRRPIENLATIVHEIIHIDSFVHQGFFVDGIYYEPYLRTDAWPSLTNEQVRPYLLDHERGVIYRLYFINTPSNHLGNIVDEINAYGHVLPFVCKEEPESTEKQVRNLIGFLHLAEGYLRTLRTIAPDEYIRMTRNKETRGILVLVIQRAWKALKACGVPEQTIPAQEAAYFMQASVVDR